MGQGRDEEEGDLRPFRPFKWAPCGSPTDRPWRTAWGPTTTVAWVQEARRCSNFLGPCPRLKTTSNKRAARASQTSLKQGQLQTPRIVHTGAFKSPAYIVQNICTKCLQGQHNSHYINRKSHLDTVLARVCAPGEDVDHVDLRSDGGCGLQQTR
jgi:hypothetical protein